MSVTGLDPTTGEVRALPGGLEAVDAQGNIRYLQPVSFAEYTVRDANGTVLQVSPSVSQGANIELPVPVALRGSQGYNIGDPIECYLYDPKDGKWKTPVPGVIGPSSADGQAVIKATIFHLSWYGGAPTRNQRACIEGYVKDKDGRPLAGVDVEAFTGGAARTDAQGFYQVDAAPGTLVRVVATIVENDSIFTGEVSVLTLDNSDVCAQAADIKITKRKKAFYNVTAYLFHTEGEGDDQDQCFVSITIDTDAGPVPCSGAAVSLGVDGTQVEIPLFLDGYYSLATPDIAPPFGGGEMRTLALDFDRDGSTDAAGLIQLPGSVEIVDPVDGSTMRGRTADGDVGVYRSVDDGVSWTGINEGLPVHYTQTLSLVRSGIGLFAGTYYGGVYRSTDDGRTWINTNNGLLFPEVWAIAALGTTLFVGTAGGGAYVSDNGGTWRWSASGLANWEIWSLTVMGADVFAGTGGGVFRSTDGGESWTVTNLDFTNYVVLSLAVMGDNLFAGTQDAGVHLSSDRGATWQRVSSGMGDQSVLAMAVSGTTLFAGTLDNGVYMSTDSGSSWTAFNSGLPRMVIIALAVAGEQIFAGAMGGVFYSNTAADRWTDATAGLGPRYFYAFDATETDLFAATGMGVWRRPLSEFVTDVEASRSDLPHEFSLAQNYPNPFNPSTSIGYQLPDAGHAKLSVYDLLGREVTVLVDEQKAPGSYSVRLDADGLASGTYVYMLRSGGQMQSRKMTLVR